MQTNTKTIPEQEKTSEKVTGRIQITRQGRGFLISDDARTDEIVIPAHHLGTALPDDKVLTENGRVTRVLERRRTRFVGTLRSNKNGSLVVMDDPLIRTPFSVKPQPGIRSGNKIVVELRSWKSAKAKPQGVIVEDLGAPHKKGVDTLSVLRQYDLTETFPEDVMREAKKLGTQVTKAARAHRTDCRNQPVITIDPETARDFDDAFSLEKTKTGNWCLRVHIADVSTYVRPGSALDREARKRGNSTYLVDRVIPMLPEVLSNELCSLKPGVDRLTKCVECILDPNGQILRTRFFSAVIHSQRRYSYEQALDIIEGRTKDSHTRMIQQANLLAQKLRQKRFKQGGIHVNHPSIEMKLDKNGRIASLTPSHSDAAHQLIEEFMLLSNDAVANRLKATQQPTIYRTHAAPDCDRLKQVQKEILQHHIACGDLSNPLEVQKLFKRLEKHPMGELLKISYLKVLNRASYSTEPKTHHGLAKTPYAHFTSPIRRYADLEVHRSLFESDRAPRRDLEDTATHLSAAERNASAAERDSRLVKLIDFLERQRSQGKPVPYEATVTGVSPAGLQIELPKLGMRSFIPSGRRKTTPPGVGTKITVTVDSTNRAHKSHSFRAVEKG